MSESAPAADFSVHVIRADDLLALTFDFFNMRLDAASGPPPNLVRITAGQPAFIVANFPPQHIEEQFFAPSGLVNPPANSVMAGPSRLAFRVPDAVQVIPLTLHDLLNWSALSPNVTDNAVADPPPPFPAAPPQPAAPTDRQTAIELPYRLILSPDASAGWAHAVGPVSQNGVTELWHTRLDVSRRPTLRAVFATDIPSVPDTIASLLDSGRRAAIVHQSSDFSLASAPPPLDVGHLFLSALGAWAEIRGEWDAPQAAVADWHESLAQGRDQYRRVVTRGFLYPFGHRASLTEIGERKVTVAPDGSDVEYVLRRSYVTVLEPVKDYAQATHPHNAQLPLRVVRLTTLLTPDLPQPLATSFLVGGAGNTPLPFHLVAEDWLGQRIDFSIPLAFVPLTDLSGGKAAFGTNGTVDVRNQRVALAPHPPTPGATTLSVSSFDFDTDEQAGATPPFLPFVTSASVHIAAVDHLLGSATAPPPVVVELLDPDQTPGEVFVKVQTPVTLAVPTAKAGGIAAPRLNLDSVSRLLACDLTPQGR